MAHRRNTRSILISMWSVGIKNVIVKQKPADYNTIYTLKKHILRALLLGWCFRIVNIGGCIFHFCLLMRMSKNSSIVSYPRYEYSSNVYSFNPDPEQLFIY